MKINLSKIADFLSLDINGDDAYINNLVIDSRKVSKGDLFVAIPGQRYDGHTFINKSIEFGASAVLCEKSRNLSGLPVPYIICNDTVESLGIIAHEYRKYIGSPFTIGITGTNGKTSVTKLTAEILSQSYSISTTIGNYNNQIGLPLSILQIASSEEPQKCIYELGASKKNDISTLVNICEPDMTTLLNISEAHMESFGSINNLIQTKEEIFSHPNTSHVILNADDKNYDRWKNLNKGRKITTLSLNDRADYYIKSNDNDSYIFSSNKGEIRIRKEEVLGILPINILFSMALSMEAGASINDVKNGIKSYKGVKGRFFHYVSSAGSIIIDDSYNANPESMKSSLKQLKQFNQDKIFVMGDMGELGESSLEHHIAIFKLAREYKIKYLFYMGRYEDEAKSSFGDRCFVYKEIKELTDHVRKLSSKNTVILIKASRYMNFDLIVKGLK